MERAHRTHTEEFYEVIESSFNIAPLGSELLEWEGVYNTIRPHQPLGYLISREFVECYRQDIKKAGDVSPRSGRVQRVEKRIARW